MDPMDGEVVQANVRREASFAEDRCHEVLQHLELELAVQSQRRRSVCSSGDNESAGGEGGPASDASDTSDGDEAPRQPSRLRCTSPAPVPDASGSAPMPAAPTGLSLIPQTSPTPSQPGNSGSALGFASFRPTVFLALLTLNMVPVLHPAFLRPGPSATSNLRIPQVLGLPCRRKRRQAADRDAPAIHTLHLDTWSLTQYSTFLFYSTWVARLLFWCFMTTPLLVAVATAVSATRMGVTAAVAQLQAMRWVGFSLAAHFEHYLYCLSAYVISAVTDAIRWSHVTRAQSRTPRSRTNGSQQTSTVAQASQVVEDLRRATPLLSWSSFGAGVVAAGVHMWLPSLGPADCAVATVTPLVHLLGAADSTQNFVSHTTPAELWQVALIRHSVTLLRMLAAGFFGGFVSSILYSVRASTYWQLGVLHALDSSVREKTLQGRFFLSQAHVDEWQRLTESASRLTRTYAKLHRRVAEKLVFACSVLMVGPLLLSGMWLPACLSFFGVPRSMPSPWLVWCAALQTAALVVLITWFLFLWAAVEQAEKKLPSVLLLGAERAAAQGHMLVSVRLTALHALRVRSHSSPVVFQVIPASAAFNVIVGAMSVGTVYEMVAVAAKFLADPCASSFAAGSHEHSAVVDTVVEGATPDVIVIPTPSGLLPFEVAVDHLIAVADTLVSLVWEA